MRGTYCSSEDLELFVDVVILNFFDLPEVVYDHALLTYLCLQLLHHGGETAVLQVY